VDARVSHFVRGDVADHLEQIFVPRLRQRELRREDGRTRPEAVPMDRIDRKQKRNPQPRRTRRNDCGPSLVTQNVKQPARLLRHQIRQLTDMSVLLKLADLLLESHPRKKVRNTLRNGQFRILVRKNLHRQRKKGEQHHQMNFLTRYLVDVGGFRCNGFRRI
jgi:hypothetical protein